MRIRAKEVLSAKRLARMFTAKNTNDMMDKNPNSVMPQVIKLPMRRVIIVETLKLSDFIINFDLIHFQKVKTKWMTPEFHQFLGTKDSTLKIQKILVLP